MESGPSAQYSAMTFSTSPRSAEMLETPQGQESTPQSKVSTSEFLPIAVCTRPFPPWAVRPQAPSQKFHPPREAHKVHSDRPMGR